MTNFLKVAAIYFLLNTNSFAAIFKDPLRSEKFLPQSNIENCQIQDGQESLDLIGAVDIALCNNSDTQIAWFNAKASAGSFGKARSQYLPSVKLTVTDQKIKTNNSQNDSYSQLTPTFSLNYLLFDFGGREANVESAKQQMLAAGFNYNLVMQSVVFQVVRNYANVLIANESLNAAKKAVDVAKEILEATQVKMQIGVATSADEAQAQTAYSQSLLDLEAAKNNLEISRGNFAMILHLSPTTKIELKEIDFEQLNKPFEGDIAQLIDQALKQRPDVALAQAKETQAKFDLVQAKEANYPSISLIGSSSKNIYNNSTISNSYTNSVGLQLTMPLFSGFGDYYQVITQRHSYKAAQSQLSKAQDVAKLDVWTAYNNYQTARTSYKAALDLLKSAQMSESLTLGRYKVGKGSLIDALNAQSKSASARFSEVQAKNNLLVTKFDLDRALGIIGSVESN